MRRLLVAPRLAPLVAGLAGLGWFWAELAPQRYGFQDTDDPALGLQFVAAHPDAWRQAGFLLGIASLALVLTVLTQRERVAAGAEGADSGTGDGRAWLGSSFLTVVGVLAASMLFGMAVVRLAGGPMLYVESLDQRWGETAYLVTQFVGIQLLAVGGLLLLSGWIVGTAWLGLRRGVMPRAVGALAVLPGMRLVAILGLVGATPDGLWFLSIAAIPAAFAWLVLLGAWPAGARTESLAPSPVPV